ncbi:hypothetical protein KY289_023513 [Solanum tuberosum]|nr:hypothetical protein KY289_023513 [Solanum tuberosum]
MGARIILEKLHIVVQRGQSLTRSMYLQLLGELPRVRWKGLIFQNQAQPKATFTLWLCLQGRLLTAEILNKWGLNVDPTCVRAMQTSITPQSWTQHLEWNLNRGKGKSVQAKIFRMLNAEIVHAIWNERNTRIF